MSSLSLDHIILVVSDLQVATRQFTQLGFSVVAGGVHSGGFTQNALIPFPDGTYFELLATTRKSTLKSLRFLKKLGLLGIYTSNKTAINRRLIEDLASGVGMNDFALLTMDLEQEITRIKQRGTKFTDPIPGGRLKPDGKEINWRTAVPFSMDLPFLIEDLTSREIRVPEVKNDYHSNGVIAIIGVTILVTDLVESMTHYRALLDREPVTQPQYPQPGTQTSEFKLNDHSLSIISPVPGKSEVRNLLKYRSARPVGVFFQTEEDREGEMLSLTYLPEKGATLSRSQSFFP